MHRAPQVIAVASASPIIQARVNMWAYLSLRRLKSSTTVLRTWILAEKYTVTPPGPLLYRAREDSDMSAHRPSCPTVLMSPWIKALPMCAYVQVHLCMCGVGGKGWVDARDRINLKYTSPEAISLAFSDRVPHWDLGLTT